VRRLLISVLITIVLLAVIGGVALAGTTIVAQRQASARADLTSKFGADIVALCTNPPPSGKAKTAKGSARYLVIDTLDGVIYSPYQMVLSPDVRATSKADLTTLVCVKPNHHPFEKEPECAYRGTTKTIHRYSNDVDLKVIDLPGKKTVLDANVQGADPAECPEQTDTFNDIQGAPPTPQDFLSLLTGTSRTTGWWLKDGIA